MKTQKYMTKNRDGGEVIVLYCIEPVLQFFSSPTHISSSGYLNVFLHFIFSENTDIDLFPLH